MIKKPMLETYIFDVDLEDTTTGWYVNSLVEDPANEIQFEYFEKQDIEYFVNEEQRIVTGASIVADKKIPKSFKDKSGYYFAKFTKESIRNIMKKFSKNGFFNNISLNHWRDNDELVEGVYLLEMYQVEKDNKFGYTEGTLVTSYYVENDEVWQAIKDGKYKGFSIEIIPTKEKEDEIKQYMFEAIEDIMNSNVTDVEKRKLITEVFPQIK